MFPLTESITNLGSTIPRIMTDPNESLTDDMKTMAEAVALPGVSHYSHMFGIVVWGIYQVI